MKKGVNIMMRKCKIAERTLAEDSHKTEYKQNHKHVHKNFYLAE